MLLFNPSSCDSLYCHDSCHRYHLPLLLRQSLLSRDLSLLLFNPSSCDSLYCHESCHCYYVPPLLLRQSLLSRVLSLLSFTPPPPPPPPLSSPLLLFFLFGGGKLMRPDGWWRELFVGCLTTQQHASTSRGRICPDIWACCHTVCLLVGCLNVPATGSCISGTDLLRQFYVLPH